MNWQKKLGKERREYEVTKNRKKESAREAPFTHLDFGCCSEYMYNPKIKQTAYANAIISDGFVSQRQ
jgi:hypothetical protein